MHCVVKRRTGPDLLCDDCRRNQGHNSIGPTLAAQHVADLNERMVAEFEARRHELGLSEEEDVQAWQVWFGLRDQFIALLKSYGVPEGAAMSRVSRHVAYMTLRGIELAEEVAKLCGPGAVQVVNDSVGVLRSRQQEGGWR